MWKREQVGDIRRIRVQQGNGWEDPGHGGAISIQSVEWLNSVNTNYGGITVHRELWDMRWYGDTMSLAERLEHEAIGQANEQYQEDDYYDPAEWF